MDRQPPEQKEITQAIEEHQRKGRVIRKMAPQPDQKWWPKDIRIGDKQARKEAKNARRREKRQERKARERARQRPVRKPPDSAIRVYSDGDCQPNPGVGGWAAIVEHPGKVNVITGFDAVTTNNRMELMGAIGGIGATPPSSYVHLVSDSRYVIDGISKWVAGWKRRGWITAGTKTAVVNRDLWEQLDVLVGERFVTYEWVKGHSGHARNEQADRLADTARHAGKTLSDGEVRWIVPEHQPPGTLVYPGLLVNVAMECPVRSVGN